MKHTTNLEKFRKKIESGFLWFWVVRWRTTFLFLALIISTGFLSLYQIPKESSPDIKLWIISITTIYQWVNPTDMDTLITEKIEQKIKNIAWIKKISSKSLVWVSSIVVELDNDVDISKSLVDIKDAVDKVPLPSDAQEPSVFEISTDNERMFDVVLYWNDKEFSQEYLKNKAIVFKNNLDGKWAINRVDLSVNNSDWMSFWWSESAIYDVYVLLDRGKVEQLWLSLPQIAWAIRAFNKNQPLGNHNIDTLSYDFRIEGELKSLEDLKKVPLALSNWSFVFLQDIAKIEQRLKDETLRKIWSYQDSWNYFVSMTINKNLGANVFQSAKEAKKLIEEELSKQEYVWLQVQYTQDLAEFIKKDYSDLAKNGLWTIVLVFFVSLLFVWFKEALIATVSVPIAFMITFFVLKQLWLSLNFLTNFSLIVCFGIAIDATIVVVQDSHMKMRQWFNPRSAVLLAVREYAIPLISGTATTLVVFLPMLTLPGVMGKFLAYIPITIFVTLLGSLFVALTINSALFLKFSKPKTSYEEVGDIAYMQADALELLKEERKGKELAEETRSWKESFHDFLSSRYDKHMRFIMASARNRVLAFLLPLLALILSFVFISPFLGFNLFPSSDNPWIYSTISAKKGTVSEELIKKIDWIDAIFSSIPEVKIYYYTVRDNVVDVTIELVDKEERRKSSFVIEKELLDSLSYLQSYGLQVETTVQKSWPPSWKAVGIKLVADSNKRFSQLLEVAKAFEEYLRGLEGTKNVWLSSSSWPWQFVFTYYLDKLSYLGIQPTDIDSQLYAVINWITVWSLKWKYENNDIRIKYTDFDDRLTPNAISDISLPTMKGMVKVWTVVDYSFDRAITEINRENSKIVVKVESDIEQWFSSAELQSKFVDFAQNYTYPEGISFESWGENNENSDLIIAMVTSFIIAIFLILAILILQFNSYLQPVLISYSILLGILGANVGLLLTGNSYSIAFMIGFIALTWIVVNNAIVLIDRMNVNVAKGKDKMESVIESGRSRIWPILSTMMTTVLGLSSVARQDKLFGGLAYTIMFWLLVSSTITLFVVPVMYYEKEKFVQFFKRTLISFILWILLPFGAIVALWMLFLMLGFNIFSLSWIGALIGLLLLGYIFFYARYAVFSISSEGQTFLQKYIGVRVLNTNGSSLSIRQSLKRFFVQIGLLLAPFVGAALLSLVIGWIAWGLGFLVFIGYVFWNIYVFWTNDHNQFWHDRICWTKVVYISKENED
jgi:multidrug efflux pump